jgi:hypothetical protein
MPKTQRTGKAEQMELSCLSAGFYSEKHPRERLSSVSVIFVDIHHYGC